MRAAAAKCQPLPFSTQECLLFGSAADSRALAGDINAINVCYDFLLSTLSSSSLGALRLDSLAFTEDYFVVYNGGVITAANPYFVFAQQLGLSSVATDGYTPKGKPRVIHSGISLTLQQCKMSRLAVSLHFWQEQQLPVQHSK
jgi:hypothetical protein